ncbi:MAG: DUF2508 family protein [Oscillospiraceae bacterium]|jgi:hypothetical protein|nr:DUF2508 family protein [Oscillospiraceae bacterium]
MPTAKKTVSEREELLEELYDTQLRLRNANARFNEVSQPELIESCVFEINALKARHAYYMRVLREAGEVS